MERRIQAGARLGRFELLERIGDGAMGEVYRARDVELGRVVAVKLLRTGGGGASAEERRRRFVREQQAAARVRHHGVVAVHDAGEVAGVSWLAMDLVEGESLDALLRRGPLEPAAALRLGVACARAVEALHAAGVLHRDLKPANILIDREGNPRLTDFGVAALDGAEALTRTGQMVGTPLYMAPEQLAGQPVDARADVYGLGAVLYEALAGQPPWAADTFHLLITAKADPPPPPSRARRGASRGSSTASRSSGARPSHVEVQADRVILRALAAEPAERQPSAAALADELELALTGAGGRPARRLALAAGVLVALVALAALGALALRGGAAPGPAPARAETPAALRRRLEARAARAPRLGELEPELAVALQGFTAGPPDASPRDADALVAWAGLLALVEGDLERAAGLAARLGEGAAALAPAHALRGGLAAHRGDPAEALRELDAAGRGGLRQGELEGWRARALARRGVERADASSLLERVAALRRDRARADASELAGADLLEVACLIGLGRRVEALGAFDRLVAPPDELRWDLAVLTAADAVPIGRYVEALRGGAAPGREGPARLPRPARPVLHREEELSAQLLAYIRQRSAPGGTVLNDDDREQLAAALELRERVTPGRREPAALALDLLVLVRKSVMGGYSNGMLELLLDISEGWPDDAKVQAEIVDDVLALRFLDGGYLVPSPADPAARVEAFARRARALLPPGTAAPARAAMIHAAALLHLERLDEAARALDEAEGGVRSLPKDEAAQSLVGSLLLLRARLAARRGDVDGALARVAEAEGRIHAQLCHWVRLDALQARPAQLLEETSAYAREGPFRSNMAVLPHLQDLLWRVLGDAGRWAEVSDYFVRLLDTSGRSLTNREVARALRALLEQGRLDEAVERARLSAGVEGLPADLARRLREGDPDVRAALWSIAQ